MDEERKIRHPGRVAYIAVVLFFALLVAGYFVYQVQQVVLAFAVALLLAVVVSGPVNFLARRGLGRGWGTMVVIGALVLGFSLLGIATAPVAEEQAEQLTGDLPSLLEEAEALVARTQDALGLETEARLELDALPEMGRDFMSSEMLATTADIGQSVLTVLSLVLVALIATIYLTVQPYPVIDGFVALFPARRRGRVRRVLGEVYRAVQRWLLGQLVAMAFIGGSSAVALWMLGIPFALLLGLFGGLVSFVPYLGAVVSAIPPVLLALVSDPVLALGVILAYVVIQQIESQVIQPVVMSKAVALHPAVVLFAIVVMGTLFGIAGLLLAVPLMATLQVLVQELWVKRMDEAGDDSDPPKREGKPEGPGLAKRPLSNIRSLYSRLR